jgi:hypothetical protein
MAFLAVPVFASPEPIGPPGKVVSIGMVAEVGFNLPAFIGGYYSEPLFSVVATIPLLSATITESTLAELMYGAPATSTFDTLDECYAGNNYVIFEPRCRMQALARDQC